MRAKLSLGVLSAQLVFGSLTFGVLPTVASAATTIFTDSFGTGSTDTTFNESPVWTEGSVGAEKRAASSGVDSASPDGGRFALMQGNNGGGLDGWICRTMSATGYNNLTLAYHWRGDNDSNSSSDDGIVEYKTTGSCSDTSGWTQLQNHDLRQDTTWTTQAAFALPGGLANSSFLLRFRTDTNSSQDDFRVDGVVIQGDAIVSSSSSSVSSSSSISSSSSSSVSSSSNISSSFSSSSSSSSSVSSVVTAYVCHEGNTTLSFELPTQQAAYDAHIAHEDMVGSCSSSSSSSSSSDVNSSSSSESSFSSQSSSAVSDIDEDGIPSEMVCSTTMSMVCTPQQNVCTPGPETCTPGPETCTPGPVTCIEDVCTPGPDVCVPGPDVCVPGPEMCVPQEDICIAVPSTTCIGPDNCPLVPNPGQENTFGQASGDACEEVSEPNDENQGDNNPTNGSYRGSRTNVLRSVIAMFGGQPTGVPPPAYGGPGAETFTPAESQLVCRVYNAMADDASNDVYEWAAVQLSTRMPHSVRAIIDALRDGGLCPEPVAKVVKDPKPVAIRIDANGFPVSSNETWNKCVAGTATLDDIRNNPDRDEDGFGYSCSRYHTQDTWTHPDHPGLLFTWKRGMKFVSLPAGYALKQDTALTQK